ncbi:adenylate kinase [Desulfotalea psychrophila]|uniref:Adenylate kinase n=1 Tax=Desulfotalea psychrophila (strain LSv54 / DSM 12343) TaxID=177439 RepID=KAD_DESPS|nr:adenylate kinase [Desulfotalea psychrophila]Q6AMG3.1 RecName: Full=Adenylate kinase; Short=AK; AltName: Full=ATP-AMP transphosphorylase; AltName: Full=ATP:AMP phosphotransferase; AltName: Full=Adenylate monophosphate kinase [Desulfotalea psychrophila LSv54]CAG36462.1 probable adenylate kinase [Desulfotalea psychrophila LSv54]
MGKNILFFGPNGSGKGTQGAIVQKKYDIPHIESGAIFREHIGGGTELGLKAKEYIERGDLVPDEITIPMMVSRLQKDDCKKGWILDGFPRSKVQAITLAETLAKEGMALDYVIEIVLDRDIAKERIMGRRLCVNDNNHPNHIAFEAIKPVEKDGKLVCRVCGGDLKTRPDDQDVNAINKRHGIYYDEETGTMAAVNYFKNANGPKVISIDGSASIGEVTELIMKEL